MTREQLESKLDDLIEAHGHKVHAAINAAACRTRYDWEQSHAADDAYEEAYATFINDVSKALERGY